MSHHTSLSSRVDPSVAISPRRQAKNKAESIVKEINFDLCAQPPLANPEDRLQSAKWEAYLELEESNPVGLDDKTSLARRVLLVYQQYLLCFARYTQCVTRRRGLLFSCGA